ncbi:hypothetical protein HMPREF1590_01004 [Escherichia coli 113302]|nr:hypothetical protein HMPREF1590_01004 [Escherichia coli 113302]
MSLIVSVSCLSGHESSSLKRCLTFCRQQIHRPGVVNSGSGNSGSCV